MSLEQEKRFRIGASHTIGSYVLPGEVIDTLHHEVDQKIKLTIAPCDEIVEALTSDKLDLGFIEFPMTDEGLCFTEWMHDEMVLCSKKPLPSFLGERDLNGCRLICREKEALERQFIENFLEDEGLFSYDFAAIREMDNPTAIIQSIKWSKPHAEITSVAIVSKLSIEYELKYNDLHASRIHGKPLMRTFYVVYKESLLERFDLASLKLASCAVEG